MCSLCWGKKIKPESGLSSGYFAQGSQKDALGNPKSAVIKSSPVVPKTLPQPPPLSLQPPPLVLLVWADKPSSDAGNPLPWTCDWKDNISKNRTNLKGAHENQVASTLRAPRRLMLRMQGEFPSCLSAPDGFHLLRLTARYMNLKPQRVSFVPFFTCQLG